MTTAVYSRQGDTWQTKLETTSLPGINEMFPEHFMKYSNGSSPRYVPTKADYPETRSSRVISQDITLSPSSHMQTLRYVASTVLLPPMRPPSSQGTNTPVRTERIESSSPSETCTTRSSTKDVSEKKHACPVCSKRFSRPSSLRIHVNTQTGETRWYQVVFVFNVVIILMPLLTAFRCPYPGCGREFNVNSNMRRHYRNHGVPGGMPNAEEEEEALPLHAGLQAPQTHQWIQMEPMRQINSYPMSM
uniref:C2H2-type domain-containing protein n=1 Tax=Moniliophthora roreri TaxID=221103 RepID=A0A0W0EYB1_MONRR